MLFVGIELRAALTLEILRERKHKVLKDIAATADGWLRVRPTLHVALHQFKGVCLAESDKLVVEYVAQRVGGALQIEVVLLRSQLRETFYATTLFDREAEAGCVSQGQQASRIDFAEDGNHHIKGGLHEDTLHIRAV